MKDARKRAARANPVPLGRILVPLTESLGIGADIRLEQLKRGWSGIVGKVNAANTRPVALTGGVLTVAVTSPAWIVQARFYSSAFVSAVNGFDPHNGKEIREIRFTLERT
jgi:predicted nucleic acid-binding Zn ribbon protein